MRTKSTNWIVLFATGVLASAVATIPAFAQTNLGKDQPSQPLRTASSPSPVRTSRSVSPITDVQKSRHSENFYKSVWGIENLEVRETASGVLLRFSYQITDANKAAALNDKKATPYLIDEKTGAVLQIPTMPKVGMLRQTATAENGREYWMVFSNKGNFVKPRSRVDIVIGQFRAKGLIVR